MRQFGEEVSEQLEYAWTFPKTDHKAYEMQQGEANNATFSRTKSVSGVRNFRIHPQCKGVGSLGIYRPLAHVPKAQIAFAVLSFARCSYGDERGPERVLDPALFLVGVRPLHLANEGIIGEDNENLCGLAQDFGWAIALFLRLDEV